MTIKLEEINQKLLVKGVRLGTSRQDKTIETKWDILKQQQKEFYPRVLEDSNNRM